jgi:hypothetical protein
LVTAEEHRRIAWDCLKLSEATSNPQTHAALLNLAQYWVRMAEEAERHQDSLDIAPKHGSGTERERSSRVRDLIQINA